MGRGLEIKNKWLAPWPAAPHRTVKPTTFKSSSVSGQRILPLGKIKSEKSGDAESETKRRDELRTKASF